MEQEQANHELLRHRMVEQLRYYGVTDPRVLAAMARVPRHCFVPGRLRSTAYEDRALPIGHGQTISQPLIVAEMLQAARLTGADHVLDVGAGSGYQAALLGELAGTVYAVEIIPELVARAREVLASYGASNVSILQANGSIGWHKAAPYDAILVAAAAPAVPDELLSQLKDGGRLVIPVGESEQELLCIRRYDRGFRSESIGRCTFVPLVGERGISPADSYAEKGLPYSSESS